MSREFVRIFEVGPRDGLQNETRAVSMKDRLWFVSSLIGAGIRNIELGAFVKPDRVPRMADTDQIYSLIQQKKLSLGRANAWSLVPNRAGLHRALQVGVTHIAVFTAATESFALQNMGMTIQESLGEFRKVISAARKVLGKKLRVRGYVSTAFGCPFEGKVIPKRALRVIENLAELGVDEISIGDTIGVATPRDVEAVIKPAILIVGAGRLAGHFHDTSGTALANALRAIDLGIRTLDSSAGGLGGCPFAPGATGNLATEDLVYMLHGMKIRTGIDLDKLCEVSVSFCGRIGRALTSKYLQAYVARRR